MLFRLYQQCILATQAPPKPAVDILVLSEEESVIATLQGKTRTGRHKGWPMTKKHEEISAARYFYAFVDLRVPEGDRHARADGAGHDLVADAGEVRWTRRWCSRAETDGSSCGGMRSL